MTILQPEDTRIEWYYVYVPELDTDPLTVAIFRKPVYMGLFLAFENKLVLHTDIVDLTNPHHPFIIGVIVEGQIADVNLASTRKLKNADTLQRISNRPISFATICRRRVGLWRANLHSYRYRQLWSTHSYRHKKGELDGSNGLLLRIEGI